MEPKLKRGLGLAGVVTVFFGTTVFVNGFLAVMVLFLGVPADLPMVTLEAAGLDKVAFGGVVETFLTAGLATTLAFYV